MHEGSIKVRRLGLTLERGHNVNGQKNSRGKTAMKCARARHSVTKGKMSISTRVPTWIATEEFAKVETILSSRLGRETSGMFASVLKSYTNQADIQIFLNCSPVA